MYDYTIKHGMPMRLYQKILLIMRLTTVILMASLIQVSATGLAQKVTLSENRTVLTKVFDKISTQTGYDFLFTTSLLNNAKPVTIQVKNADLDEVLRRIFEDQPFQYTIGDKSVVIKEKEPSFLEGLAERWADITVRGRVLDENARPLPQANVQIEGKENVYQTNDKGEFEIKGVADNAKLIITYVGYKILIVDLKNAIMPLEIKLDPKTGELQEVKVTYNTGYQELNLKNTTGSVVQIDNELFNRQVGTNVLDRIYNVTSGLVYQPGLRGSAGIVIRGISTINASTAPLVVVDNFPYEGELNKLNPNDCWASWCKPCRAEVPKLKMVYDKYKIKGLNIVGISSDKREADWKKAVADDKTAWSHVLELDGNLTKSFRLGAIPAYILVDRDGKLVAFDCAMSSIPSFGGGLRGENLDKILEELLGK